MQVLKERIINQSNYLYFQSSWHILSLQNGNASCCCVVSTLDFHSRVLQNNEPLLLIIYFFSSALNKVVPTLLSSRINRGYRWVGDLNCKQHSMYLSSSPRGANGFGLSVHIPCLSPWRPGSEEASVHECGQIWTRTIVLLEVKSRVKSCKQLQPLLPEPYQSAEFKPLLL